MSLEKRWQTALESPQPAQHLLSVVKELFGEGYKKEEVYESLERLLVQLRAQTKEGSEAEDLVLDVMDALTGWCHPQAQLSPKD